MIPIFFFIDQTFYRRSINNISGGLAFELNYTSYLCNMMGTNSTYRSSVSSVINYPINTSKIWVFINSEKNSLILTIFLYQLNGR